MAKKEEPKAMTVQDLARMGGKARAKSLTKARRKEIGKNAVEARWAKKPKKKKDPSTR